MKRLLLFALALALALPSLSFANRVNDRLQSDAKADHNWRGFRPNWTLPTWNTFVPAQHEAWNSRHNYNDQKWRPEIYFRDPANPGAQVGRERDLNLFAGRAPNTQQITDVLCPVGVMTGNGGLELQETRVKGFTNSDVVCSYFLSNRDVVDFSFRKSYFAERTSPDRIKIEKKFFGIDQLEMHHQAWKKNTDEFYAKMIESVDTFFIENPIDTRYTLANVMTGIITLDENFALGTDAESRLILHPLVYENLSPETIAGMNLTQLGMIWNVSDTIWKVMIDFALVLGLMGMAWSSLLKPAIQAYQKDSAIMGEISGAWESSKMPLVALGMIFMMAPIFPTTIKEQGNEADRMQSAFQYAVQYGTQTGNMIANKLALELDRVVQKNLINSVRTRHVAQNDAFHRMIEYDVPLWIAAVDDYRLCQIANPGRFLRSSDQALPAFPNGAKITYEACVGAERVLKQRRDTTKNNIIVYMKMLEAQTNAEFKDGFYNMWIASSRERREHGWWQIVTNFPASSILASKYIANWSEGKHTDAQNSEAHFLARANLAHDEDQINRFIPDAAQIEREGVLARASKSLSAEGGVKEGMQVLTATGAYHLVPGFSSFQRTMGDLASNVAKAGMGTGNKVGDWMKKSAPVVGASGFFTGPVGPIVGVAIYAIGELVQWASSASPVVAQIIAMVMSVEVFDQLLEALVVVVLIMAMILKIMLWILQLAVTMLVSPLVVFYSYYVKEKEIVKTFLSRTMFVTLLYPALIVIGGTLAWAGIFLIDMLYSMIFSSALRGLENSVDAIAVTGAMGFIEEFAQTVVFYSIGSILLKLVKIIWIIYIVFRLPTWLEKQLGMDGSMDISNWNMNDAMRGMRA